MKTFQQKYGPWALVTGASAGIGEQFARLLAAQEIHLALVARREDKLESLASELANEYPIESRVIAVDLSTQAGLQRVIDRTQDLEIGLLVNNAGIEDSGHFLETPIEKSSQVISLNCQAPLVLTHHFANKMALRQRGGIVNMSSLVAFQGVPYIANYAATKAYDLVFSESLAAELKPQHIDVLSVNPGFTKTNLSPNFNFDGMPMKPISAKRVARDALNALGEKRVVVPGAINKLLYLSGKYLQPRKLNTFAFGKVFSHVLRHALKGNSDPALGKIS